MCGIAGVLELERGREPSVEGLRRMAGVLAHRGPDDEGIFRSGRVGLAHRRLSIIDLASGHQPMESPGGDVCVIFNGEIYNYLELKRDLEQQGHVFRTTSDTEVLLAQYVQDGLDAFRKLNGMFACAIWDRRAEELVLVRDRLGKKPMFYCQDAARLLFGSEIKALLAHGGMDRKVNPVALHEYLTHGYAVGEETILQGIRRLPPAHVLVARDGRLRCQPYWTFQFQPDHRPPSEEEAVEHLDALIAGAVKRRLMSDVPLGAFLSGGLDSTAVVAYMTKVSGTPVKTFTIGFEEAGYSELEDARVVARFLGTQHHELIVKPAAFDDLRDLVWHLDEPFADSSAVPTYYVCRAARQHVTVALAGDGGDEVFAGYERYQELARYRAMERIPGWVRRGLFRPLARMLPFTAPGWNSLQAAAALAQDGHPVKLGLYPHIQERLYAPDFRRLLRDADPFVVTDRLLSEARHLDPVSRYQYVDTLQYLPGDILTKVDRMSMANSLEVRAPLLDYTVVEYAARLPLSLKLRDGVSKYVLRRLLANQVPPSVLTKRKQGFAIPKGQWFRKELREAAHSILLDPRTLGRGFFQPAAVRRVLNHHATGRRDYGEWIWSLLVLEVWFRLFVDRPATGSE